MNILYVIATALTVSVDALIVGYSLSISAKRTIALPLTVAIVTYLMCLVASLLGSLLHEFLQGYVKYVGAIILVGLGINALKKKQEQNFTIQHADFAQYLATGFGVGLDGAVTNLMLVKTIEDIIFVPALFAITHFIAIYVGQCLAENTKLEKANVFSAAMFFALAAVKLIDI